MDIQERIKEHWFKDHVAELIQHDDLQVLKWGNPKDFSYRCRYVFDREFIYISGDIGEAVFRLTWNASIHSFDNIHIHYFYEKLSAYSGSKVKFYPDKAVESLREWLKNIKDRKKKYDHDEMKELFEEVRECSSDSEWAYIVNRHYNFISELEQDPQEWIYKAGDEIPDRIYGYLIGLQMASEQVKKADISGEGGITNDIRT